jgi:hypothetical protein
MNLAKYFARYRATGMDAREAYLTARHYLTFWSQAEARVSRRLAAVSRKDRKRGKHHH